MRGTLDSKLWIRSNDETKASLLTPFRAKLAPLSLPNFAACLSALTSQWPYQKSARAFKCFDFSADSWACATATLSKHLEEAVTENAEERRDGGRIEKNLNTPAAQLFIMSQTLIQAPISDTHESLRQWHIAWWACDMPAHLDIMSQMIFEVNKDTSVFHVNTSR